METIEVKQKMKVKFKDLEPGDAFSDEHGFLFLKVTPTCEAEDADNAAAFAGYSCMFNEDEEVTKVDARVLVYSR